MQVDSRHVMCESQAVCESSQVPRSPSPVEWAHAGGKARTCSPKPPLDITWGSLEGDSADEQVAHDHTLVDGMERCNLHINQKSLMGLAGDRVRHCPRVARVHNGLQSSVHGKSCMKCRELNPKVSKTVFIPADNSCGLYADYKIGSLCVHCFEQEAANIEIRPACREMIDSMRCKCGYACDSTMYRTCELVHMYDDVYDWGSVEYVCDECYNNTHCHICGDYSRSKQCQRCSDLWCKNCGSSDIYCKKQPAEKLDKGHLIINLYHCAECDSMRYLKNHFNLAV